MVFPALKMKRLSNGLSGVGNLAVIESAQPLCFRVRILKDSKENKRHAGQTVQGCLSDWRCRDLGRNRAGDLASSRSSSRWPRTTLPSYKAHKHCERMKTCDLVCMQGRPRNGSEKGSRDHLVSGLWYGMYPLSHGPRYSL